MVTQHPHTIQFLIPWPFEMNENNDLVPIPNEHSKFFEISGRFQTKETDSSAYVFGTDGATIDFSGVIYCPKFEQKIKVGTQVTVFDEAGEILFTSTVKLIRSTQINVKIWV